MTRRLLLLPALIVAVSCSNDDPTSTSSTAPVDPVTTAAPTTVPPTTTGQSTTATTSAATTRPATAPPTTAATTAPPTTAATTAPPTTAATTTAPPTTPPASTAPPDQLAPLIASARASGLICGQAIPTGDEDPPRELPQDGGSVLLVECERQADRSVWSAAWFDGATVAPLLWQNRTPDGHIEEFVELGGNLSVEPSGSVRVVSRAATDCDVRVYRPSPAGMELLDQQHEPCPT